MKLVPYDGELSWPLSYAGNRIFFIAKINWITQLVFILKEVTWIQDISRLNNELWSLRGNYDEIWQKCSEQMSLCGGKRDISTRQKQPAW